MDDKIIFNPKKGTLYRYGFDSGSGWKFEHVRGFDSAVKQEPVQEQENDSWEQQKMTNKLCFYAFVFLLCIGWLASSYIKEREKLLKEIDEGIDEPKWYLDALEKGKKFTK